MLKHIYIKCKKHSAFSSEVYFQNVSVTVAHSPAFLTDDTAPSRVRSDTIHAQTTAQREKSQDGDR